MATTTAQGGCRGDTSIYNQNGLTVPFKNLCGKDIQKVVDFLDPTDELTWSDCLDRCVMKAPLCYGFDFTPHGTTDFSCWLMNATFAESDATTQNYKVDAAILDPELMSGLSSDCRTLGLQGCFQKNGRLSAAVSMTDIISITTFPASSEPTRVTPAIVATTAVMTDAGGKVSTLIMTVVTTLATGAAKSTGTVLPGSSSSRLSTGVKAGIGAGIGAVLLIAILVAILCVLKRRKRKYGSADPPTYESVNEKIFDIDSHQHGATELQAVHHGPYGSPELAGSVPTKDTRVFAPQEQIHEIDGSNRYDK
ncbi:hypothetical protein EKO04_004686 [Ascochyta lentis]|uniref:Apple domain-containing protein n=1 Tax=Ascochyta lentis TaxID=205686 RepID=A0A8H7J536_9PLEO|nr:hypothetical protein EKO04_004686 [Ascochyta lentis]